MYYIYGNGNVVELEEDEDIYEALKHEVELVKENDGDITQVWLYNNEDNNIVKM